MQSIIDVAHQIKCDPNQSDAQLREHVLRLIAFLRDVVEIGGFYGSSDPTQELIDSVGENILERLKSMKPVGVPNSDTLAAAAIESTSSNGVSFPVGHSLVASVNEFLNKFAALSIQLCASISSIDGSERRVPHRTTVEMLSCVHAIQATLTKALDHIATARQLWRNKLSSSNILYPTLEKLGSFSAGSDSGDQNVWDYLADRTVRAMHTSIDAAIEGAGTLNALILRLTSLDTPGATRSPPPPP